MCVVRYLKPDQRAVLSRWADTRRVLCRGVALLAAYLWWTAGRGWRLVRLSVEKFAASSCRRCCCDHVVPGAGRPEDATDGVKCDVLYDPGPGSALVDVVFIHGLRGDKLKTWKQGVWKQQAGREPVVVVRGRCGPSSASAVGPQRLAATDEQRAVEFTTDCWPRDWLPLDCPYVRVIAISYSTDPYLWRPIWLRKPVR